MTTKPKTAHGARTFKPQATGDRASAMPVGYIADTVKVLNASVARKGVADAVRTLSRGPVVRPTVVASVGPSSKAGRIATDQTTVVWESYGVADYKAATPRDPRVASAWAKVGMLVSVFNTDTGEKAIGKISAVLVPIAPIAEKDPNAGTMDEAIVLQEPCKPVRNLGYVVTVPVYRTDAQGVRYECGQRDRTCTPRDCSGRRPKYVVKPA